MSQTAYKFRCRNPIDGFAREADGLPEPIDDHAEFKPTQFRPGADQKIEVMRERYARGLPVFHPDDLQVDDQEDRPFATIASLTQFLEPEDDDETP